MADAISIEETNRLRISLGMKPLPVPGTAPTVGPIFKEPSSLSTEEAASTLETRQAEGYDNYRKLQEAEEVKRKRAAKNEAIKKARDTAKRFAKLDGKGLGDADDNEDLDARTWLIKSNKRKKEIEKARKLERERMEEEARLAAEYTAKDLAGVKVGHELDSLADGEDQVLTLKDTTIDENEEEGDELENLDLREREKLNKNLELKKKKPAYNPNDDDGSGTILAHYDEEIDGKKNTKRFTLDGMGSTTEMKEAMANGLAPKVRQAISLDILKDEPKSDYLDTSEIKLKKPKKSKKSKSTRQKVADEDDIFPPQADTPTGVADTMDIDQPVMQAKKRTYEDTALGDDDDLQASLAAQRRAALKKRKKNTPEDIARRVREEASATPAADATSLQDGGLVIDETSEFVANLQMPIATEQKSSTPKPAVGVTAMDADSDDEDGDVHMSYANIEDDEDVKERLQRDISSHDDIPTTGIEEESTLDNGVGATLKLLKDRGIIKTADSGDLNAIYRDRQKFLGEKQRREAAAELKARQQRERDRISGRLDRMSAREREEYARQQNNFRDQAESRQLAEHFNKEYKPNVELKYIDDHGRSMNQKEAFKHLSHQFHGKGSGKQKTEKKLKKIEEEKRMEAKSTLDASGVGGMNAAVGAQTKKRGQAGVRMD